jgi:hypothetical protein
MDLGALVACDASYKYTYLGKEGKHDKIRFEVSLLKARLADAKAMPGQLGFKLKKFELKKSRGEGVVLFDRATGRVVSSAGELRMDAALVVDVLGQQLDVGMSQREKTTVKITDTNPLR